MLLAINHGANHGISKTLYSGFGNLFGNLLMALVSILGLGAILIASGIIFNIIKWTGIIYLIFVGLKLILEPVRKEQAEEYFSNKKTKSRYRLFVDGFIIAIGNPKGILFFTALFPQFINLGHSTLSEYCILVSALGVVAFGCYMLYAFSGAKLNRLFRITSFRKIFNRITGTIFIGTGVAMAFSKK